MKRKNFTSRIDRIAKGLEGPGLSVINQHPGESLETLEKRADDQAKENIRQFSEPGLIVVVSNYSGAEVEDVTNS